MLSRWAMLSRSLTDYTPRAAAPPRHAMTRRAAPRPAVMSARTSPSTYLTTSFLRRAQRVDLAIESVNLFWAVVGDS